LSIAVASFDSEGDSSRSCESKKCVKRFSSALAFSAYEMIDCRNAPSLVRTCSRSVRRLAR
jgi:hypothetical protein